VAPFVDNRAYLVRFTVTNRTPVPWPTTPHPPTRPLAVVMSLQWIPHDGTPLPPSRGPLGRDVMAGETARMDGIILVPERPGRYQLELAIRQIDGAALSSPTNPLRVDVSIPPIPTSGTH
jgi:hypothetical protein